MAERVTLEFEGLMLEKLLNIALNEGIELIQAVRLSRRRLSVTCSPRYARQLRAIAEKYRVHCVTAGAHGICALVPKVRSRVTAVAAFIAAIGLSALFLSRIWVVDIELKRGDALPDGVLSVLDNTGIIMGKSAADAETGVAAAKLSSLDGCAHASVSREGVAMRVEIVCEVPAPGLYEIGSPRDLVALCDGVVSSVNVKNGTAMVVPGDTVRKGQVLISGYERDSGENIRDLGALGSVTARIWYESEASAYISAVAKQPTGRTSAAITLCIPWLEIPLYEDAGFERSEVSEEIVPLSTLFVPIYIRRALHTEYEPVTVFHDLDALKTAVGADALASARAKMAQNAPETVEIIDHWTDFGIIESDILSARAVIEAEAEIAVTRGYLEGY